MTGRPLPPAGPFAGDDGSADPAVAAALASLVAGSGDLRTLQHALVATRVLVPIVAAPGEVDVDTGGRAVERSAHMSTVTITGHDGRRALPVFTSLAALAAWDPQARPFPASAVDAARGAYEDGAEALLVDPSAAGAAVVEGAALLALAEGRPWLPPAEDPDLLAAVAEALRDVDGLAGWTAGPGAPVGGGDLLLTLRTDPAAGPRVAPEVARTAAERLAGIALLRARLDRGVDLAVSPPGP